MSSNESINASLVQEWGDKVILVVEDVDTNKIFFDAALRKTHATILWAKDGQEAIDMFKVNRIDLVLMDLQLPIIDGYTATRELKKINSAIPIIAQTAHVMSGERKVYGGRLRWLFSETHPFTNIDGDTLKVFE